MVVGLEEDTGSSCARVEEAVVEDPGVCILLEEGLLANGVGTGEDNGIVQRVLEDEAEPHLLHWSHVFLHFGTCDEAVVP